MTMTDIFSNVSLTLILDFGKGKDDAEEELSVWEDNWDDDNLVEDDFSEQLKAQMKK